MDQPAALRPLLEASDDIRRLEDYDTPQDLASAITAVVDAIERSLRTRLRRDSAGSEEHRLSAFAPDRLSLDEVIQALRTRDLISLETAGRIHEARGAGDRAVAGDALARDGDVVMAAVERLRRDLGAGTGPSGGAIRSEAAGPAPASGPGASGGRASGERAPVSSDAGSSGKSAVEKWAGSWWMRWIAAAFAAVIVVGAAWVAIRGGSGEFDAALAAFRAGRTDSAAAAFQRVVEDQPRNVTAMLYLARSHRRLERPAEAAEVLRRALQVAPEDGDVRRELGHLFLDLGRPESAVAQYERALEYDPDNPLNWAALIRAHRRMGDPRAEQLLRDAPAAVRNALGGA